MKIGQLVRIIDWGQYFPRYQAMADRLKATKWRENGAEGLFETNPTGIIKNKLPGVCLVDIGYQEILISEYGLKRIKISKTTNPIRIAVESEINKLKGGK